MLARPLAVFLALGAALSGCATVMLPPDKPLARPVAYRGYSETFPTGLRLVAYEQPHAQRVKLAVSYRVGALDEPKGKEGIAHLAEHLAFRTRPGGGSRPTVASRLLVSGARYNAFTTHDTTDYWSEVPREAFSQVLALEALRMRDPLAGLTEAEFLVEREVVINEIRQRQETSPEGLQLTWLQEVALAGTPYGRSVGGTPASLATITLEDVRAFFRAHYTPAHAVVVINGPLEGQEMRELVVRNFSTLATGDGKTKVAPVQHTPPAPPTQPAGPMVVKKGAVDQPTLWLAWPVPGYYADQGAPARTLRSLMLQVIDQGMWDDERMHGRNVFTLDRDGVTLMVAMVQLNRAEDAAAVAERVKDQLVNLVRDQDALDRSAVRLGARMLTGAFLELEGLDPSEVARYLRARNHPDYVGGWQKQIVETHSKSLAGYAHQHLTRENARVLLVVPERQNSGVTLLGAAAATSEPHDEEAKLPAGARDVTDVARAPGLDRAARFTLSNGLPVVLVPRAGVPLVDVRLVLRTPPAADLHGPNATLPQLALATSWASVPGEHLHGPKIGSQDIELMADDHLVYGAQASAGNVLHVVDDIAQWLRSDSMEVRVFDHIQKYFARAAERALQRPDARAEQELARRLFPGHVYGATLDPEVVRHTTREDAARWVAQARQPQNATLLIAGEVEDTPELRAQLETLVGGWGTPTPAGGARAKTAALDAAAPPPPAPALPAARSVVVVDKPGASQAVLHVGLRLPVLSAEQDAAARALTWGFQRQLERTLREARGVTYGVSVSHDVRPAAASLVVRTAVEAPAAARALETVLAELGTLEELGWSAEQTDRARWQVAREYDLRFATVDALASSLAEAAVRQHAPDYFERYPAAIAALSPASLQGLVAQLNLGKETVVVMGDAATLVPQLTQAGYRVERAAAAP